jgi:hypothetical protein
MCQWRDEVNKRAAYALLYDFVVSVSKFPTMGCGSCKSLKSCIEASGLIEEAVLVLQQVSRLK